MLQPVLPPLYYIVIVSTENACDVGELGAVFVIKLDEFVVLFRRPFVGFLRRRLEMPPHETVDRSPFSVRDNLVDRFPEVMFRYQVRVGKRWVPLSCRVLNHFVEVGSGDSMQVAELYLEPLYLLNLVRIEVSYDLPLSRMAFGRW